jgi:hypothetical protein
MTRRPRGGGDPCTRQTNLGEETAMNFLTAERKLWKETVDRFMDEEITREYIRACDIE